MKDSRERHQEALPNEAEFQAYYLMTHIDNVPNDAATLPRDIYNSEPVQFACAVHTGIQWSFFDFFFRNISHSFSFLFVKKKKQTNQRLQPITMFASSSLCVALTILWLV